MKIFWPLPNRSTPPSPLSKNEDFLTSPNFCCFPDFILEESVWHAINLWGHWEGCSFTRDQNHSSNHSGAVKNFIFLKWYYIQVQFNPLQANAQFLCQLKTSGKQRYSNISREYSDRTLAWNGWKYSPNISPLSWPSDTGKMTKLFT